MIKRISAAALGLAMMTAGFSAFAHAADVIDGIVATVNGRIILQSDWEDAISYEAFMNGRPPAQMDAADRKAALDHLIDQELLQEQMHEADFVKPTQQQIENQIAEIRKQYKDVDTAEGWKRLLTSAGLSADELRRRITLQLQITRLVDERLRPIANVTAKNIESYYNHELLPQLRRRGSQDVPLAEVRPKIKELLTQQQINQLLITWLQDLHAGSQIHTQPIPGKEFSQ